MEIITNIANDEH